MVVGARPQGARTTTGLAPAEVGVVGESARSVVEVFVAPSPDQDGARSQDSTSMNGACIAAGSLM
jgi:hypothetical protein